MRTRFPYPWRYNAFIRNTFCIEVSKITYRIQTTTRLLECPRARVVETTIHIFGWFNFSKYDVLQFEKGFCVVYMLKKYLLNNVKTEVHTLQLLETSTKSVYDVGTRKNSFFWCFEKYISNRSKHYFLIKGELEMKFPSLQLNIFQRRYAWILSNYHRMHWDPS